MTETFESLIEHLRSRGLNDGQIVNERTDLVVEGFPRSSNSFCVSFISLLLERAGRRLSLVHHTHQRENCELAVRLERPCLVLIREPVSAIASFMIYAGRSVESATNLYLRFYEWADTWQSHVLFADFDLVVSDINRVVAALNSRYGLEIPYSADLEADSAAIKARARERAQTQHGESDFIKKVGVPTAEREALKANLQPKVQAYLDQHPEAQVIYDKVRRFPAYLCQ